MVVPRPLPKTLKMAKLWNLQACNVRPIQFIERVRSHLILWDSRDDEYKLAEKNPYKLRDGIAAQCDCH